MPVCGPWWPLGCLAKPGASFLRRVGCFASEETSLPLCSGRRRPGPPGWRPRWSARWWATSRRRGIIRGGIGPDELLGDRLAGQAALAQVGQVLGREAAVEHLLSRAFEKRVVHRRVPFRIGRLPVPAFGAAFDQVPHRRLTNADRPSTEPDDLEVASLDHPVEAGPRDVQPRLDGVLAEQALARDVRACHLASG